MIFKSLDCKAANKCRSNWSLTVLIKCHIAASFFISLLPTQLISCICYDCWLSCYLSYTLYASMDRLFFIPSVFSSILDFFSLQQFYSSHTGSLTISKWYTWLPYLYSWLYTLHTLLKVFRLIYFYNDSYSFASPIFQTRKSLIMLSQLQLSVVHKLKNP